MRWLTQNLLVVVIALLCGFFSWMSLVEYQPEDEQSAHLLAQRVVRMTDEKSGIFLATGGSAQQRDFALLVKSDLLAQKRRIVGAAFGEPSDIRDVFEPLAGQVDIVVGDAATARHKFLPADKFVQAEHYLWPTFVSLENWLDILGTMSVIAIMAIGLTMVIVVGGIDLAVGRMAGLSAVICTYVISQVLDGASTSALEQIVAGAVALATCAAFGWLVGALIVYLELPAFIVTLAAMLLAQGLAYKIAGGVSIGNLPESFRALGGGRLAGVVPYSVVLMLILYALAHLLMQRTVLGRYLYAVGGNREAARLAGVPIPRVVLFVYAASALLAGLGGVLLASLHRIGDYKFGEGYELYAIAAVVIGGTSLRGGEGTMIGTFLGALLIAILDKGMRMMGLQPDDQLIARGAILLVAVLIDQMKHRLRTRFA